MSTSLKTDIAVQHNMDDGETIDAMVSGTTSKTNFENCSIAICKNDFHTSANKARCCLSSESSCKPPLMLQVNQEGGHIAADNTLKL